MGYGISLVVKGKDIMYYQGGFARFKRSESVLQEMVSSFCRMEGDKATGEIYRNKKGGRKLVGGYSFLRSNNEIEVTLKEVHGGFLESFLRCLPK
jgi:hypothetical protein